MPYLHCKEIMGKSMIIHCMCCENLKDPAVHAEIETLKKQFNTELVSTGLCPECAIKQDEENDKLFEALQKERKKVENHLRDNDIEFTAHEHPAVFTCEQVQKLCPDIPGLACKNLLLRDISNDKCYLIIIPADTRVDFKKLAKAIGSKQLVFADKETLKEKLALGTGAVSPFGLLKDNSGEVGLIIHQRILEADMVSFHPNVNTATLVLTQKMFQKFLGTIKRPSAIIG